MLTTSQRGQMADRNPTVAEELKAGLRKQAMATIGIYVALGALVLGAIFIFILPTHDALCGLRGDLKTRIDTTENTFLAHPEDFPAFNDPKVLALTKAQLDGQKRTVKELEGVPFCGEAGESSYDPPAGPEAPPREAPSS